MKKDSLFYIWVFIWTTISIVLLVTTNGIGDNGDGIMHYMFARYAHNHFDSFLDPWAKTGYVLVAWPFAQFGLKGVMFLNIVCAGINLWLVYQICKSLKISFPWIAFMVLSLSTYYFKLMYSGLTEHLFSAVMMISIYLFIKNKWTLGCLVLSTLPFFRQEGYIIMGALIPFFIMHKKIKLLPLLSTSFIIIAVIGGIYYNDLLWITHSNPYKYSQTYGHGKWWTFCDHLYYNAGLINLIFFILGLAGLGFRMVTSGLKKNKTFLLLIALPFLAFFIAHSIFWYYGIFHSMGLKRVLNCVMPLFAIIAAYGFSLVIELFPSIKVKNILITIFIFTIILYPFTPSPANINFKKSFSKTVFEQSMYDACQFVKLNYPHGYIYYEHPIVPFYFQIDPFDKTKCQRIFLLDYATLKPNSILFWESGISQAQGGLTEEFANANPRLKKLKEIRDPYDKFKIILYLAEPLTN